LSRALATPSPTSSMASPTWLATTVRGATSILAKRVEIVYLPYNPSFLLFGLDMCVLPNFGFSGPFPLSMEVRALDLFSPSCSTVMADVRSVDLMHLHWRCRLMRRLNDDSGVFFRGDVVTGRPCFVSPTKLSPYHIG
jgi:hypothetical protein